MALDNLLQTIESLRSFDSEAEVETIVKDNSSRLVELETEQLAAGIDRQGEHRIDEYRPLTKLIKKEQGVGLGAVTDRVTFFMTGNLYQSLESQVGNGKFEFNSLSEKKKFDKMIDRIGPENFGLSPDQRFEFATTITLPEFSKVFEQKTGLKIL